MAYLLSDKHRAIKFIGSLLILFALSYYSYTYGLMQFPLKDKVKQNSKDLSSFPYLKVKTYKDDLVIMIDRWDYQWKIKWPKSHYLPPKNIYVSLMRKYNFKDVVYDIENIIIHEGYKVKLYISILALLPLFFYYFLYFRYGKSGFYRVKD